MARDSRLVQRASEADRGIHQRQAAFQEAPAEAEASRDAFLQRAGAAPLGLGAALAGADDALRARVVSRLQRDHGNAFVQRLVVQARAAPGGLFGLGLRDADVPEIAVDMPAERTGPVTEVAHDTLSYETEPIRRQARASFDDRLDTFANLWLTASTTALAGAPEAEDEASTASWWMALAGNLLWASTSLLATEAVVAIRVMSFVGASVGSGVGAPHQDKAPSGKEYIGQMLTTARDHMVQASKPILDQAATECGDRKISDSEEQRKVLWRRLFKTPYNESEPIRAEMNAKIKAGLAEFLEQWHTWKTAADKAHYAAKWAPELRGLMRPVEPFTPHLSFGD